MAQQISMSPAQQKEISALFQEWNQPNIPGVSVGVLSGNKVIFQQNYGQANLEYGQPISGDTPFRQTAMSSHFTAFSILLLEERGQLNLTDDIRMYLPELPQKKKTITIEHLLNHSSGLIGYWPLKTLAGFEEGDRFTKKDALALYQNDWESLHEVGEEFRYSGTAGTLLATIVERVSKQSFGEFTKTQIFQPIGMGNSQFVDEHTGVMKHAASAYQRVGDVYQPVSLQHFDTGTTGFVCSMNDLMKWYQHLNNPMVGSKALMAKLDRVMLLEDGSPAEWARGKTTYGQQFVHAERGIAKIWDSGTLGGYASSVFRFPSEGLTIAVFSNSGMTYNGYLAMDIAGVLLKSVFEDGDNTTASTPSYQQLSESEVNAFLGDYYSESSFTQRQIILREDTLRYYRPNYGSESPLLPLSSNVLHMPSPYDYYTVHLSQLTKNQKQVEIRVEEQVYRYKSYQKRAYTSQELAAFIGTYYSFELGTSFEVVVEEGVLWAKNATMGSVRLHNFKENQFLGGNYAFKLATFTRNQEGEVMEFSLSQEEMKNIRFKKIGI